MRSLPYPHNTDTVQYQRQPVCRRIGGLSYQAFLNACVIDKENNLICKVEFGGLSCSIGFTRER